MNAKEKAEKFFGDGCNCAQAVLAAYAEELGMDVGQAKLISCGLGGGVGRMREVCGAVSAAAMVLGHRNGGVREKAYPAIQDFCEKFKAESGSIVCRELIAGAGATAGGQPEPRTKEYYRKRPCVELVGLAASLIDEGK